MLTTSREYVLNNDRTESNTKSLRTNDLFNEKTNIENAFGINVNNQTTAAPSTRRQSLFGEGGLNLRPRQNTLNQLEVPTQQVEQVSSVSVERVDRSSVGLTKQNKVFIACFLVAIVALSFFMVIGAINLKNSSTLVDAQNASIVNAQNEIARLEEEINSINGAELQTRASQMGFSYSDQANSYSLLALSDNTVAVTTNWFDGLCNFISSIIG